MKVPEFLNEDLAGQKSTGLIWVDLALFDFSQYVHVVTSFCDECAQYIHSIKSSDGNILYAFAVFILITWDIP